MSLDPVTRAACAEALGYDPATRKTYAVAFTPPKDEQPAPPSIPALLEAIAALEVLPDGYSYAAFGPKTRALILDALENRALRMRRHG